MQNKLRSFFSLMINAVHFIVCLVMLGLPMRSQQISHVDLASQPEQRDIKTDDAEPRTSNQCVSSSGDSYNQFIIADGFVLPDDNNLREITLELTRLSSTKLSVGAEVEAVVQLKNTGQNTIQIPWSTQSVETHPPSEPDHAESEIGQFEVILVTKNGHEVFLKSASRPLLGSTYSTGSQLQIAPGEWITASIKFTLEAEYASSAQSLKAGEARLKAKWRQNSHTWDRDRSKCSVRNGYYRYNHFYDQKSNPIAVVITQKSTDAEEPQSASLNPH